MNKKLSRLNKIITGKSFRLANLGLLVVCNIVAVFLLVSYGFEAYTKSLMFNVTADFVCLLFSTILYLYCIEIPDPKKGQLAVFANFVTAIAVRSFLDGIYWFVGLHFNSKTSFSVISVLLEIVTIYAGALIAEYFRQLTGADGKVLKTSVIVFSASVAVSVILLIAGITSGYSYNTQSKLFALFSIRPGQSVILILVPLAANICCLIMLINKKNKELRTSLYAIYLVIPMCAYLAEFSAGGVELSSIINYIVLCFYYNNTAVTQAIELSRTERELTDQKMSLMLSQIQPHFIFNALNTICFLCRKDPKKAESATKSFASYLRMNIDSIGSTALIPFSREINHVKTYVELEQLRFGDKLEVIYDIDAETFDIPPLTLQPIVENAVKHGSCKKEEQSVIKISCKREENMMVIKVLDNGVGFVTSAVPNDGKTHVGITNVRQRVEGVCHGVFEIYSVPGTGTVVTIKIPVKKDN